MKVFPPANLRCEVSGTPQLGCYIYGQGIVVTDPDCPVSLDDRRIITAISGRIRDQLVRVQLILVSLPCWSMICLNQQSNGPRRDLTAAGRDLHGTRSIVVGHYMLFNLEASGFGILVMLLSLFRLFGKHMLFAIWLKQFQARTQVPT